jgi:pyruvate dehydrogenase E2 component (dihydrolipoamide acetyltransferase)
MAASHAEVPSFVLQVDVDMEPAVQWRQGVRERGDQVPSYNDLIVRACAKALRAHPKANGSWVEGGFELHEEVNVGVAVAAPGSLVVPVVRQADRMTAAEIGAEVRRLANAVKERTIQVEDVVGATFTVSNLGMLGVDRFEAMVDPPQAAILAVGALARRPVASGEEVVLRHQATLTLSCDHRILYGAEGAEFLADLRARLGVPEELDADLDRSTAAVE